MFEHLTRIRKGMNGQVQNKATNGQARGSMEKEGKKEKKNHITQKKGYWEDASDPLSSESENKANSAPGLLKLRGKASELSSNPPT